MQTCNSTKASAPLVLLKLFFPQRVKHYRAMLRDKYSNSESEGDCSSVKIAFKLPTLDHTYCFSSIDPVRVSAMLV